MCHVNPNNQNNEIVITHLADKKLDQKRLSFENKRFVCFLDIESNGSDSRIALLLRQGASNNLSVTVLKCDKPFKKMKEEDEV